MKQQRTASIPLRSWRVHDSELGLFALTPHLAWSQTSWEMSWGPTESPPQWSPFKKGLCILEAISRLVGALTQVSKGTVGSTQLSGTEEMASPAGPALRRLGRGVPTGSMGAAFPSFAPQILWAGLVRVCLPSGWALDLPLPTPTPPGRMTQSNYL